MRSSGRSHSWHRIAWVAGPLACLVVVATWWLWRSFTSTWPAELDPPRSETLFANPDDPTPADLDLLAALVAEIATADPVVIDLLDGRPWPDPEISPTHWTADGRIALIGGSFRLRLDQVDYQGPWPSAGCRSGGYRGTVRSIDASGLTDILVVVDLTFERVTSISIPPSPVGSSPPVVRFGPDLEDAPWYTGRCRRFDLRQG